jgi:uncharacterized protein (DUF2252 family)
MTHGMLALVDKASKRSKKDLLDARAPVEHRTGVRRFVRGERYLDLPEELEDLPRLALPIYVASLGERAPKGAKSWAIVDAAQRIAGTGSLGRVRIAILVRDADQEERILDFKEASQASCLRAGEPLHHSERVVSAAQALLESPPKLLAPIAIASRNTSMIGRQLAPVEDKLDLSTIKEAAKELPDIASRVGHILGAAHRRAEGAQKVSPPWPEDQCALLIDHALELAGIYEATYLSYVRA